VKLPKFTVRKSEKQESRTFVANAGKQSFQGKNTAMTVEFLTMSHLLTSDALIAMHCWSLSINCQRLIA
jgi:hypothetical protein